MMSPRFKNLKTGTLPAAPAFTFPESAEIAFIDFNPAAHQARLGYSLFLENHFAQLVEEQDRRVAIDASQFRR